MSSDVFYDPEEWVSVSIAGPGFQIQRRELIEHDGGQSKALYYALCFSLHGIQGDISRMPEFLANIVVSMLEETDNFGDDKLGVAAEKFYTAAYELKTAWFEFDKEKRDGSAPHLGRREFGVVDDTDPEPQS